MISSEIRVQIRRYFYADMEIGTIAVNWACMRTPCATPSRRTVSNARPCGPDGRPYLALIRQTLDQHPRLGEPALPDGSRPCYICSVVQLRCAVAPCAPRMISGKSRPAGPRTATPP